MNGNTETGSVAWLSICGSSAMASSELHALPHPADNALLMRKVAITPIIVVSFFSWVREVIVNRL